MNVRSITSNPQRPASLLSDSPIVHLCSSYPRPELLQNPGVQLPVPSPTPLLRTHAGIRGGGQNKTAHARKQGAAGRVYILLCLQIMINLTVSSVIQTHSLSLHTLTKMSIISHLDSHSSQT